MHSHTYFRSDRAAWLSPRRRPSRSCWTGIPAVSHDEPAAVPGGLVAEHPPRLPEALVGDRRGPASGCGSSRPRSGLRPRPSRNARQGRWWPCAGRRRGRSPRGRGCGRAGRRDLRRFALPCALREWARLARRSLRSDERSAFGPATVTTFPASSTPVSSVLTPRSMPIAEPGRACRSGHCALHLDGERHEPPLSSTGYRGRQDAGGPVLQPAGELPGGLVRADRAELRQGDGSPGAAHAPDRR